MNNKLKRIRDVTDDPGYKNSELAKRRSEYK